MGNCCGSHSDDNFSTPGRVLGAAPPQPTRASVPQAQQQQQRQPPGSAGAPPSSSPAPPNPAAEEARRRAAAAAEARATGGKPAGKLGDQLQNQKKQSRTDTLREASATQLRQREIDASNEAMTHN